MSSTCRIEEVKCRSALNRSRIPGMDYCLNPYTGCGHGCLYCYASFMQRFCRHPVRGRWGSFVHIKANFVACLASELQKARSGTVMLSSVTDPYQPIEAEYRLTRFCLELLAKSNLQVSILTKSDLILRDLDLLRTMPRVRVGFTITVIDAAVARKLEPGAPPPERRLGALRKLNQAGIPTWVFIAPVIPGLGDTDNNLASLIAAARQAGTREVHYDPLNFYPSAVANLRPVFAHHWPDKLPAFDAACRDPQGYRQWLTQLMRELRW